jgi:methyl-accepting chemotaxis protein
MIRLGLTAKLIFGFGMLLTMLMLSGGVTYLSVSRIAAATEAANASLNRGTLASILELKVKGAIWAANDHTFNGDPASLQSYREKQAGVEEALAGLTKALTSEDDKALLTKVARGVNQVGAVTEQQIELRSNNRTYEATDMAFSPKTKQTIKGMADAIAELETWEDKSTQENLAGERRAQSEGYRWAVALVLSGLLLGSATAGLIIRSIRRSMATMLVVIEEVAAKNLTSDDIEVGTQDEIGRAATALNAMKASLQSLMQSIAETTSHVASASEELSVTSQQITENSARTSAQGLAVSQATQRVSENLKSVSTGAGEMTSTIQSIASSAHEAASVASNAVQTARSANSSVAKLGQSSTEIGEVIKVITSIAQQTNLLALNATIEAARAGEAGKGFAVVANEVKELAKQTAKATEDISRKITGIQLDTKGAMEAIASITEVIAQINDISGSIAAAVEEQSATTNEMTGNVANAAKASEDISANIDAVAQAAQGTSASAQESQKAANDLAAMAGELRVLVGQFKIGNSKAEAPTVEDGETPAGLSRAAFAAQ